jgi:hypothetical protein
MTARTKVWTIVCLPMSTYRLNPIVRFRAYFGRFVVLTMGVTIELDFVQNNGRCILGLQGLPESAQTFQTSGQRT